ncbi:MAG TPA: AMP-binding protein [Thermohalobaculum sp.]|nr:AMP-binding protein [Thermohalobaculum sp.]
MINLSSFVRYHASRGPERTAIVFEGRQVSYAELWQRVQTLAGWLAARGIGEGEVVAVFMKNSPAFIETALATSHLGGVFLPVNYRLATDEAAYIQENAGARLLLADDEFEGIVGGLENTVLLGAAERRDIRALTGETEPPPMCRREPGDLFRLMYTSGTTDRPKGVMHSYDNFYWKCMDHVIDLGLSAEDRLLVVGPLYHVGAFDLPGLAVMWVGGTLSIVREFEEEAVLGAIEAGKLTCGWLAPVMLGRLLAWPDRERFDRSSVKWMIGGGEKTPESRIRAFNQLFPNGRYIDAYGLTETCSGDTLMEAGREIEKIGSTGRALAHCEIDIRDDDGNALPPGTQGEICVRGPKVTTGYWKDPDKTRASFFADGWFRTGDVGVLDAEGFLTITDRKKDLIISGGENISSSEVERVIYALPQVAEAAVIGVPDADWGERPIAVVVPRPGETLDYATLREHCRAHLARFKVPRELHLREALPRNPSGKILKRTLRDEFAPRA